VSKRPFISWDYPFNIHMKYNQISLSFIFLSCFCNKDLGVHVAKIVSTLGYLLEFCGPESGFEPDSFTSEYGFGSRWQENYAFNNFITKRSFLDPEWAQKCRIRIRIKSVRIDNPDFLALYLIFVPLEANGINLHLIKHVNSLHTT
jgi:hypothetical protein